MDRNASISKGLTMHRRRIDVPAKIVWRMSAANPMSVDIDLNGLGPDPKAPPELPDRGWLESSRELLRGVHVRETPMDALPGDLIDAFFRVSR